MSLVCCEPWSSDKQSRFGELLGWYERLLSSERIEEATDPPDEGLAKSSGSVKYELRLNASEMF